MYQICFYVIPPDLVDPTGLGQAAVVDPIQNPARLMEGIVDGEEDSSADEDTTSDEDEGETTSDEDESSDSDDEIGQQPPRHAPRDANNMDGGDRPLYAGATLTLQDSLIAIMTFVLTHSLTGACLLDLLSLIALHCPLGSLCVKSLYMFKKYFKNVGRGILVCHYFCSNCYESLENKNSQCTKCKEKTEVAFFIEIPIINQLQIMFRRPGFLNDLQFRFRRQKKSPGNVEDIYDGEIYKEHVRMGFLNNPHNISFMWYTDGICVFNFSNKFSIWPFYLVINELSYKNRVKKQNIILAGIWFGKRKPKVNTFLTPFHSEMSKFYRDGYMMEVPDRPPILVKGVLLCGTCDLPAKCAFLRLKQYNGFWGCNRCLDKGQQFEEGSNVHVYPYSEDIQPRINADIEEHARIAIAAGSSCYGVKGMSILYRMHWDMIRSVGVDSMHGVFSGLGKMLLELWFDIAYKDLHFSLYHLLENVETRLKAIKVPSFLNKYPQSIADLTPWKSLDFKVFLLYYSIPALLRIMPDEYMEHHMLLVSAVYLLSQRSISPEQIDRASVFLNQYVKDFERLYHLRFMGINVHQLVHLPDVVRCLGPLWVYACYFLEDLNGKLCRLFHGTRHVGIQIASATTIMQKLSSLINAINEDSPVRKFCDRLQKVGSNFKKAEEVVPGTDVVGTFSVLLNVPMHILFEHLRIRDGHFQLFGRLRMKGVFYVAECYTKVTKKQSSYVSFTKDDESLLGSIKQFIRRSNCNCLRICLCQPSSHICIIQVYERVLWEAHRHVRNVSLAFISAVRRTERTVAVPISNLRSLCFHMLIDENGCEYIMERVNELEAE